MKKIMETFTINDFFNEQNEITNINEEAYHHIEDIRETIDSCTRTSDECFYIIDYHKKTSYMFRTILLISAVFLRKRSRKWDTNFICILSPKRK